MKSVKSIYKSKTYKNEFNIFINSRKNEPSLHESKIATVNFNYKKGGVISAFSSPLQLFDGSCHDDAKFKWPESSNLCCWWCRHTFKTKPVGCPIKADLKRHIYWLEGLFCSWNCCRSYSAHSLPSHLSSLSGDFINALRSEFDDDQRSNEMNNRDNWKLHHWECPAAPHWSTLIEYGGCLTIDEFRTIHCGHTRMYSYPSRLSIMPIGFDCFEEDWTIEVPTTSLLRIRHARDHWNKCAPMTIPREHIRKPPTVFLQSTKFDPVKLKRKNRNNLNKYKLARSQPLKRNDLFKTLGLYNKTNTNEENVVIITPPQTPVSISSTTTLDSLIENVNIDIHKKQQLRIEPTVIDISPIKKRGRPRKSSTCKKEVCTSNNIKPNNTHKRKRGRPVGSVNKKKRIEKNMNAMKRK